MARSQALDADELFETANRLQAEGKEVTAVSLLNALGRGSLTTIYRHLETWKNSRPARPVLSNNETPELVKNAFAVAWREARQEAALEVEAIKTKAAEETQAAIKEFHGALEAIEKLEKESDQDASEIELLKTQVADAQSQLAKMEAQSVANEATAKQLLQQADSQAKEFERLRQDNEKQRTERDAAIKEAAELKGRAESLQLQNKELLAKLTDKEKHK